MEKTCFLLSVTISLAYCIVAASSAMAVTNITTDQSALLALKAHITFDPNHELAKNWTTSTSVCNWVGVICSTRQERVAALNIPDMGLIGTIPSHLGNLTFLVRLNISNNSFHGDLPKELSHLRRLKFLSFAFNNFGGQIPSWLGALTELQFLFLGNNSFTGTIPVEIGNLSNLKRLNMSFNQLTGSVPHSIFNISSLQLIDFSSNGLSGNLPSDMCDHLSKLEFLYISHNELEGQIPSSLQECSKLQILELSFNKFSGPIPSEIGNLTMLQELYLGMNNFKGEIPQQLGHLKLEVLAMANDGLTGLIPPIIFNISSLKVLIIVNNSLSGSLPMDMCRHLPMLEVLHLYNNELIGSLPSSFGNCTLLKELALSGNNFSGSIPQEIGNLHNLEWLSIFVNNLSGPIPSNIFNISTLKHLSLVENQLSGFLPSSIGDWLPNIQGIYLGGNMLSGTIPNSISNASTLVFLELSSNSFSGDIPNTLGNLELLQLLNVLENNLTSKSSVTQPSFLNSLMKCKHLRRLWISANPLSVTIPDTIGNLSSLESFWAGECKLMGNIPGGIGNLSNLISIDLLYNYDLSGAIPATVGQLQSVQYLNFRGNKLQGAIPNNLCELRNLAYLILGENDLSGSLPACLGNLTLLRSLLVDSNGLTWMIPLTLWNLDGLLALNLSSNSLSGELPLEIGNLKVVNRFDLSRNQLYGDIPSSIGSLQNVLILSFAQNRFQGPIPQSFGNLLSLEYLDLSQNNLSSEIPKSLEQLLHLDYLNLSFNKLEGEIPEGGPFENFTIQSFMGNKALCGVPRFLVQPCSNSSSHHRSRKTMAVVVKYVLPITASVVLILVLALVLTCCGKRKIKIPKEENLFHGIGPKRFSYHELLQATSGFTECNLLGRGSFSSVYKGTFSDGMTVAIKVFDLQHEGSLKSFDIECEVIRNVRHRNLIKVIGSCSNLNFKALVIDYMSNGSLEKWLYHPDYYLDMLQRLNIMIDVAFALEYLHHGYWTPVVHCDVKPSNVLLDQDLVAHLGDYGVAKLLGNDDSIEKTMTLATIGYIAPEYGSRGIVSTKGDVYSYGIMLLETFTKKKPTDIMFVGEMSLKHWVNESLPYAVIKVVDANVLKKDDEYFSLKEHCIKSIMELAISCCAESLEKRVNMKYVTTTLETIKVEFLTTFEVQHEICHYYT